MAACASGPRAVWLTWLTVLLIQQRYPAALKDAIDAVASVSRAQYRHAGRQCLSGDPLLVHEQLC